MNSQKHDKLPLSTNEHEYCVANTSITRGRDGRYVFAICGWESLRLLSYFLLRTVKVCVLVASGIHFLIGLGKGVLGFVMQ